ncbi:carboxyl transferase domain-containing protein [Streptomyces sp. INA 01156]
MPDHRQRPDRTGRCRRPLVAEEGPARQRHRARQPAARDQPRRVRRRRPALPEGDLHPGGAVFRDLTRLSAAGIPTVAVVFGNSTAGGAYVPACPTT